MLYASYLNGVRFGAAVIDEGEQIFEEATVVPSSTCVRVLLRPHVPAVPRRTRAQYAMRPKLAMLSQAAS